MRKKAHQADPVPFERLTREGAIDLERELSDLKDAGWGEGRVGRVVRGDPVRDGELPDAVAEPLLGD